MEVEGEVIVTIFKVVVMADTLEIRDDPELAVDALVVELAALVVVAFGTGFADVSEAMGVSREPFIPARLQTYR